MDRHKTVHHVVGKVRGLHRIELYGGDNESYRLKAWRVVVEYDAFGL